jgi:sulfite exporter TauE/SafE
LLLAADRVPCVRSPTREVDPVPCCDTPAPLTQPFELPLLFVTGLVISLGHCLGMCGPLVTAYSATQGRQGASGRALLPNLLLYHGGRLGGYAVLGAAMALLGSTALLAGEGRWVQGGLSLVVGALMLLFALGLAGWLPTQRWLESGPWQTAVAGRIRGLLSADTAPRRLGLGVANGFLPCGPVFTVAMTAAATGAVWKGAVAMLAFGLGTVPVLLALGLGAGRLGRERRRLFNRLGTGLILVMAVQLVLRGLAAWEVVPHLRWGEFVVW